MVMNAMTSAADSDNFRHKRLIESEANPVVTERPEPSGELVVGGGKAAIYEVNGQRFVYALIPLEGSLNTGEESIADAPPKQANGRLQVDFTTMTLRHDDQGPFAIKDTLRFQLLKRLSRRPGVYVHLNRLKQEVWEDEQTEDDTVKREIRRLNQTLNEMGLTGLKVLIGRNEKQHTATLILS